MVNNQNYIELIVRYLSGEITHDEIIRLESWMGEKTANRNLFNEYKKVWESLGKVADTAGINVQEEWEKMKVKMRTSGYGYVFRNKTIKERNFTFYFVRIAAVLLIGLFLGITGILINRNLGYISYTTDETTMTAQLPDGSQVTLNSNSSLRIQKEFRSDQRVVDLVGEAYFEVTPDSSRPFIVNADRIEIKVLGTSFNVNAYQDDSRIEVIVNTGQVAVTREGETTERIILKPGNRGIFNKSDQSLIISVNKDPNFLSWKTKQLVFEGKTLEEIIITINKIYHSNILITGDSLKKKRVTTSFNDQSLDAILNVLSATLDLNIREKNGDIVLSKKE